MGKNIIFASLHGHPGSGRVINEEYPNGIDVEGWEPSDDDKRAADVTQTDAYVVYTTKYLSVYNPETKKTRKILTGKDFKKYLKESGWKN